MLTKKSKSAPRSGARNTITTSTVIDLNVLAEKVAAILSRRKAISRASQKSTPQLPLLEESMTDEEIAVGFQQMRDALKTQEARP